MRDFVAAASKAVDATPRPPLSKRRRAAMPRFALPFPLSGEEVNPARSDALTGARHHLVSPLATKCPLKEVVHE
jgi:hypothetical protein